MWTPPSPSPIANLSLFFFFLTICSEAWWQPLTNQHSEFPSEPSGGGRGIILKFKTLLAATAASPRSIY